MGPIRRTTGAGRQRIAGIEIRHDQRRSSQTDDTCRRKVKGVDATILRLSAV